MSDSPTLDASYWEERWTQGQTGWDIGAPSMPLQAYIDQLENKELRILIPGCGNGWEGEYLHRKGFKNVFMADLSPTAFEHFLKRVPDFPKEHLLLQDFFALSGTYDLILEQTFFCAIPKHLRQQYAAKTHDLLNENGKLVGVLFDIDFGKNHPPFGGSKEEYVGYFESYFHIKCMETAHNSIKPRAGHELFINLAKK